MGVRQKRNSKGNRMLTNRRALGNWFCGLLAFAYFAVTSQAQPIRVMSEFARFAPQGEVFASDTAGDEPIEILSPPLIRGAWNAFRIVVDVEPGQSFDLYTAQNPENAMAVRVFREVMEESDGKWRIARRERVLLPYTSKRIPAAERNADRTTYTFWFEIQPPRDYPTRRLKMEPQVHIDGQWFTYPMEIRVMNVDIDRKGLPDSPAIGGDEAPLAQTDAPYEAMLTAALCGERQKNGAGQRGGAGSPIDGPTQSYLAAMPIPTLRTREYDAAGVLARALDALAKDYSPETVEDTLLRALGASTREAWCAAPAFPRQQWGAEWPVILRNRALQLSGNP